MQGQRIGYIRVSSFDQNPERQLEHIQVDKVFIDKASGKTLSARSLTSCSPLYVKVTRSWYTAWIALLATWMICADLYRD